MTYPITIVDDFFEDPDGIRLEVNYVPNKGIFEKNAKFNPSGDY